jgi:hypothetical protein
VERAEIDEACEKGVAKAFRETVPLTHVSRQGSLRLVLRLLLSGSLERGRDLIAVLSWGHHLRFLIFGYGETKVC